MRIVCSSDLTPSARVRSRGGLDLALAQLAVEEEQGCVVLAGHPEPLDNVGGRLLLLDLFGDEPVEEDLRREVVLPHRELVQVVDAGGYLLLVLEGLLEGVEGGAEGVRWRLDGLKLDALAAI